MNSVNRPVRTRMRGGVGAGGEKPPATRLAETLKVITICILKAVTYWICYHKLIEIASVAKWR